MRLAQRQCGTIPLTHVGKDLTLGLDRPAKGWGLRFFDPEGKEWRLLQIAPGPRLTLASEERTYWTIPPFGIPAGVTWEPYEAAVGARYETQEDAEEVGRALDQAAEEIGKKIRAGDC